MPELDIQKMMYEDMKSGFKKVDKRFDKIESKYDEREEKANIRIRILENWRSWIAGGLALAGVLIIVILNMISK